MAFEEFRHQADQVQNEAKQYLESSVEYYKLWGFKVLMKSAALSLKTLIVILCLTLVFFFGSVAAALAIGQSMDNMAMGFLILGGFYLVLLILIILLRETIIEGPMLRKFSDIFFND